MDPNTRSQIQNASLQQLQAHFSDADPTFLLDAIDAHLPSAPDTPHNRSRSWSSGSGSGKAPVITVDVIVQTVSAKLWGEFHGEYPRVAWKRTPEPALARRRDVKAVWDAEVLRGKRTRKMSEISTLRSREVDMAMVRNFALIRLHTIFPQIPISLLRQSVLDQPSSVLSSAAEQLLRDESAGKASRKSSRIPRDEGWSAFGSFFSWFSRNAGGEAPEDQPETPVLRPSDLFRSDEYRQAAISRLHREFPVAATGEIEDAIDRSGSYAVARQSLERSVTQKPKARNRILNFFKITSSSSAAASRSPSNLRDDVVSLELEEELSRIASGSAPATVAEADETLARLLNAEWTPESQKFTCGCCFDDVPYEDVGGCEATLRDAKAHWFCVSCIKRTVEEHVFGGAPLMGYEQGSSSTGVRCLSIEGCQAAFSAEQLERLLPASIMAALDRQLAERAVQGLVSSSRNGISIVQCPFCPYKEVEDGHVWARAMPLWFLDLSSAPFSELASAIISTLGALLLFIPLLLLAIASVIYATEEFEDLFIDPSNAGSTSGFRPLYPLLEPDRVVSVANRFLTLTYKNVVGCKEGRRPVFQCRNGPFHSSRAPFGSNLSLLESSSTSPSYAELIERVWGPADATECGKLSCLVCSKEWTEGNHVCFDEEEKLRLSVEKAMSEALKRTCPKCGVAFIKSEGCNKMTCRCGFVQCYCCRLPVLDGYAHYCQHLHEIPGRPCSLCNKCWLWQKEDESKVVAAAADRAREEWLANHPEANVAAVLKHLPPMRARRDKLTAFCSRWLEMLV